MKDTYDAFISYSHEDMAFGRWFHTSLEFFGRTGRSRRLRAFRDETSLAAGGALKAALIDALERSSWLILIASPASARSQWVRQELDWWWDRHGSYDRVVVVLASGDLRWDRDGLNRLGVEAAMAPWMLDRMPAEPRFIDLRGYPRPESVTPLARLWARIGDEASDPVVTEGLATIASPVLDIEKEVLAGNERAWRRRAARRTRFIVSVLALALVLALVALVVALAQTLEAQRQRRAAVEEAQVSTARLLSSSALQGSAENSERSSLLAVEGYRLHRDHLTQAALYQVVDSNPYLADRVTVPGTPYLLEGSAAGQFALAATDEGVYLWDTVTGDVSPLDLDLGGERVDAADLSWDGYRLTIATKEAVWLRPGPDPADGDGTSLTRVDLPGVLDVGTSDDGETVVALRKEAENLQEVLLLDASDGTILERVGLGDARMTYAGFDGDEVVLASGVGGWQRRPVADLGSTAAESSYIGVTPANGWSGAIAADAGYFGFVKYTVDISTNGPGKPEETYRTAPIPGPTGEYEPRLFEIAPDGSHAVVGGGNEVWLMSIEPQSGHQSVWELTGAGLPELVTFLHSTRLVSAHGSELVLWDLSHLGGPRQDLAGYVVADGPTVGFSAATAISDDEKRIASVGGFGQVVHGGVDGPTGQVDLPASALPMWRTDGSLLLASGHEGFLVDGDGRLRRLWTTEDAEADPWFRALAVGVVERRGSDELVVVDQGGTIQVRSPDDGALMREVTPEIEGGMEEPRSSGATNQAAISPDGKYVVVNAGDDGPVVRVDLEDGSVRRLASTLGSVVIDGDRAVVVTGETVHVFDPDGEETASFEMTGTYTAAVAVVPSTDLIARVRTDGRLVLADLRSGVQVADYRLPSGISLAQSPWLTSTLTAAGDSLYSATATAPVVRWDLSEPQVIAAACRVADRDLHPEEWQEVTGSEPPADLTCNR